MTDVTHATQVLNNQVVIPTVGLGVWQAARGSQTQNAVRAAVKAGYRHIDTARIYGNERDVGEGLRSSGVPRSELFVTTKLWNDDQGYDAALEAFDASLQRLGLEYIDLYLIHWPVPTLRLESWRALERLLDDKRVRAIGVSNFMPHHLDELMKHARVKPAVNQIELHPFLQQRDAVAATRRHGIAVEAYSPLVRGQRLSDPRIVQVAKRLGRTPAQVLLRWGLDQDFIVLPKSVTESRIIENAQVFDFALDAEATAALDGLEEGRTTGWDPRSMP